MKKFLIAAIVALFPAFAFAQVQFPSANPNAKAFGAVAMCVGLDGVAKPGLDCSSYANLAANATTTLKSGAGFLSKVTINTKGASSNTLTLYDNTAGSGTKIATIDTTLGGTLPYEIQFTTGLTAVMATGTAADVTISYR